MNYEASIRAINAAQAHYFRLCDLAETDDAIGAALETLNRAKQAHRDAFGTLVRIDGEWI